MQINEILCKSKPKIQPITEESLEITSLQPIQSTRSINYQRLNHLYQKGKQKVIKGIINELEGAAKKEQ